MKKNQKLYVIPVFIPHLGCPNDCSFCNQKNISGKTKMPTKDEVKNIIEEHLKNMSDDIEKEIAFFGGSFTGIDIEKQKEYLEIANEYIKNKKVKGIRLSTRPDYINKEILKMLKKYNVRTIELGVQSTNDYILKRCDRGHTFEDVKKASKLIRRYRFNLGHQIMVGLPESTKLDEIRSAKDLIKLKPKMVRIYPVLVIKGTKLEKELEEGEYKPLTVLQAVERCKELLYLFNKKKIQVIRVGLQNTDEITDPSDKESKVFFAANEFLNELKQVNTNEFSDVKIIVLGPVTPRVAKIGGKFRIRIIIKCRDSKRLREMIGNLLKFFEKNTKYKDVSIFAELNPENVM